MNAYEKWINLRIQKWDRLIKKKKIQCLIVIFADSIVWSFYSISLHVVLQWILSLRSHQNYLNLNHPMDL